MAKQFMDLLFSSYRRKVLGLLLLREPFGNQVRYWANRANPIYAELAEIFRKTSTLADVLRGAFARCGTRFCGPKPGSPPEPPPNHDLLEPRRGISWVLQPHRFLTTHAAPHAALPPWSRGPTPC
jgi:hypothetical protein